MGKTNHRTAAQSEYSKKLLDPRWQKRRLQVLDRDGWKCAQCERGDLTLHVHHRLYERGRDPWEYEDGMLVTLCERCHGWEYQHRREAEAELLSTIAGRFWVTDVLDLAVCLSSVPESVSNEEVIVALTHLLGSEAEIRAAVDRRNMKLDARIAAARARVYRSEG